jgi:creatinine amidohydrolase
MIARPDLVHLDRAPQESGADQARVKLPQGLYTGIWWYAQFPNHYAGEGAVASRELGEFETKTWINAIVQAIRAVKADQESLRLQNEFFERSKHPLERRCQRGLAALAAAHDVWELLRAPERPRIRGTRWPTP